MTDNVILLLTALSSILFSFVVVTFFDTDGITDASLSRDLNQITMTMTTLTVTVVFSPLQEIANIVIEFLTMLITRAKWVFAFLLLLTLTLLIHYYHASMLTIIDDGWTCTIAPAMKNILTPLLQVVRLFYALFIPIVNAFIVLHGQLFKAWYITAAKCNSRLFLNAVGESALVVKTFSTSTAGFFGYASTNENSGGNFMTNNFELSEPIYHGLRALSGMEDVAICVCARFELIFNLLFLPTHEPHLVAAIDNYYQMFVRIGQSLFSVLEGKLPDIYRINFKYERYLLESALAIDSILFKAAEKVLYELSIGLQPGSSKKGSNARHDKEKNAFVLKNRPLEGPFTIGAHNTVALWHAVTTIGVNGPMHLMSIFDNKHQTSFDVEMWSLTKSLSQIHKAVYAQAALMQWLTYVIKILVTESDTALQILKEETIPLDLTCNWAEDVAKYRYVPLHETVGCSYYYFGLYTTNIPFIVWGTIVELLVKTIFSNKQDMFRTLQRWEGPSIARTKIYTCEERAKLSAFDYTTSDYLGGSIWTQDGGKCQCNLHYGTTLNEGEPLYNPWCGQPNLNFDVFAPMDAMIMHMSHGILGPGFGDAFPFVDISDEGVGIKVEGPDGEMVNKFVKIPRALVPLTRTMVESIRVLVRVALSWNDIVTGHWFNYPVNCGHGLNNLHIEKKYTSTKDDTAKAWVSLDAQEKINSRWAGCEQKKYKSSAAQVGICKDNENSDCMCSYLQPLKPTSKCMCISRYPDLDVTASNQEVGDLIDDRFTSAAVSEHWCNSLTVEWTFQNTGAFADALDYMVSLGPINPNCDVADRAFSGESLSSDNPDNRKKSVYLLANTPTLKFSGEFANADAKLNHIKELYSDGGSGCTIKPAGYEIISDDSECPSTHPFPLEYSNGNWYCYAAETIDSDACSYGGTLSAPEQGRWNQNKPPCTNDVWSQAEWSCDDSERFKSISEVNGFKSESDNCPQTYPFALDYQNTGNWYCYKTLNTDGEVCSYGGTSPTPTGRGKWNQNKPACTNEVWGEAGCRIWGRFDFFCSAGLYVRNSKRLAMNLGRQFVHNGISIMAGNYADINFETLPRMCDYERQMGAIAAMIAGLIPNVRLGLKKALAKYINMVIQVMYIQSTRTVLVLGNIATKIVMDFKDLSKDTLMETFEVGMEQIVDGYIWAVIYFWENTGELLNEIKPKSGQICESIVKILELVRAGITEGLLDVIGLLLELILQFMGILYGNLESIPGFYLAYKELWGRARFLIFQSMFNILGAVFDVFTVDGEGKEGFGVILKGFMGTVCELLNTVMGTIDTIIGTLTFGVASIGWEQTTCFKMDTDDRRRLEEDIDITQKIAETLQWNGTSVCDHFMTEVAQYKYVELRPLEKATWLECIESKFLGIKLQSFVGSIKFPDDIFYNWKRKYIVAFDAVLAFKTILEHYTLAYDRNWGEIRLILLERGIDADLYIQLVQSLSSLSSKIFGVFRLTNLVEKTLGFIDPEFNKVGNPSESARIWRTYSSFKTAADITVSEWSRRDMTQQAYQAKDAMVEVDQHLHKWWATVGKEGSTSTHTTRTFDKLKRKVLKGWHHLNAVNIDHRQKQNLKSPLITHIKTCKERGDGTGPTWCTNCNIMDNAIEQIIVQAKGLSNFYTNTKYGLPWILENVTLYFDELAEYNSDFFDTTFNKLSSAPMTQNATRWTFYVAQDWELLFNGLWLYLGNGSHKDAWLNQVDKFLNASRDFITVSDSTYIPFYGYSFFHIYDYFLFSSCNLEESIFVTTTTQEKRLEKMDNAIMACLILILIIITSTSWSVIPLVWLANTIVIAILVNFLYLYMVYGYMLSCYPLSPYTLVEDINAWYHTRLDPDCFYKNFPNLAINPSEDTCLTCYIADPWTQNTDNNPNISMSVSQSYINCADYVSNTTVGGQLTLPDLMEEYFIFWPLLFWLRWQYPGIGTTIVEWGLFDIESVVGKLALSAYQQEPVDIVWIECYNVMWMDNIIAGIIILSAGYIALRLTMVAIKTSIQIGILAMYTYTTVGYVSLTLEKSVVEKAKLH